MKEIYFVDLNQNVYDKNENIIGRVGTGYVIDTTRSNLIFNGEEIGKFINISNQEDIKKFNQVFAEEEKKNVDDLEVSAVKTITKEENGLLKNYVVTEEGHIYDDNNSNLNFNEKRKRLLIEWLDDPLKSSRIAKMTPQELDKELIDTIKRDYKEYSFNSVDEMDNEEEKKRVAGERAMEVDGKVNGELGIIQNDVGNENDYSTVEQRGNEYVVVNPTVVSNNLKSSNVTSGSVVSSYTEQTQSRESEQTKYYYLDNEKNVYDDKGNMLEGVNPQYVMIDEENNLLYMNEKVGVYGGTLDELAQNMRNAQEQVNVRSLKKDNNAGFGQIIIVALVLLCLGLFIAVIVLSLFS